MKIRYVLLLMFGSIVLTGSAIAFGYFLSLEPEEEEVASSSSPGSPSGGANTLGASPSNSTGQLIPLGVNDNGNNNSSQTEQSRIPNPDEFEAYEQYANEEGTLVQELEQGTGIEVRVGDLVAVTYKGWLTDGTLFDQSSTDEQGQLEPLVYKIGSGQVIRGWDQGIVGMNAGGKRRLIIPAEFAYGEQGKDNIIPPNAMLVFDIDLIQVQAPDQQQSGL